MYKTDIVTGIATLSDGGFMQKPEAFPVCILTGFIGTRVKNK